MHRPRIYISFLCVLIALNAVSGNTLDERSINQTEDPHAPIPTQSPTAKTDPAPTTSSSTTTAKPLTTSSSPAPITNATTTSEPTTTKLTTSTPPTPPTNATTTQPTSTTSPTNHTTTLPTTTPHPPPPPPSDRKFDAFSFLGGFALGLGLVAIGILSWKFYLSRQENYYHTL